MNKQELLTSLFKNRRPILNAIGLILTGILFLYPFLQVTPVQALPAGFQEYYVLGNEEQIWRMMEEIRLGENGPATATNMNSVVTLVATTDNQVIYYDHWEDGYEVDILNPVQSSTQIFGDGNPANGGTGADILKAGQIISLNSDQNNNSINGSVPVNPRNPAQIRYDGGDYILSSGGPIDVAHPVWPQNQSYTGDAWEVYSAQAYQGAYTYRLPIGADLYNYGGGDNGYFGDFKYVWLQLEAFYDNTHVSIDNGEQTINITLAKGQTYSSMGYIDTAAAPSIAANAGTRITTDKETQVGLITAADGTFQFRSMNVLPYLMWGTEYVAPVPRTTSGAPAQVYIFNPNDYPISVTAYDAAGSGTFSIPANVIGSTVAYSHPDIMNRYVPVNSAVRLVSDNPFNVFITADTSSTTYDWGFSAISANYLTDDYYLSWAPGADNTPPTVNGSPLWVTPLANNTTFYVDYGPVDGLVDQTFTLNALEQRRIFDPDNDNTGMHVWATGKFAAAWGQDPATAGPGTPYLDLGYTVLPLYQGWLDPVLILAKSASPDILPIEGGASTFTLQVKSYGPAPITGLVISDTLPISWTYRAGTTLVTYPDGSTASPEPIQNGGNLFWNLGQTMQSNQTLELQYQAQIQTGGKIGVARADNFEAGQTYAGGSGTWLSAWTETSESDGPTAGRIQIVGADGSISPYGGNWQLRLYNQSRSIQRSVDLSDFARPMLRFKRYVYSLENGENFYLDIQKGSAWTNNVLTWNNSSLQNTWVQEEVDLSPYAAASTTLRFRSPSDGKNNDDRLYIDDIEIYDAVVNNQNQAVAIGSYNGHLFNATAAANVYLSALNLEKAVSKSSAQIGETLVYTLTYHNSGAITTTNTVIDDALPLHATFVQASNGGAYTNAVNLISWTVGSVAPSATGVVTFSATIDNQTANGAVIENMGRIRSNQTDSVNSNHVQTTVAAPALSLSLTGPAVAAPGDIITYTLTYANHGNAMATGALIAAAIPPSTTYVAGSLEINTGSGWVALSDAADADAGQVTGQSVQVDPGLISGALAAAETGQARFAVIIDPAVLAGTSLGNVAYIHSDQITTQPSNLFSTNISPLSISKAGNPAIAIPGETVAFSGDYANNGTITLTNIVLIDSIPAHTQLISGTVTGSDADAIEYSTDHGATWSSSYANPALVTAIRWSRASLLAGESGTIGFQVKLADPLPANTTIQNVAKITSTQTTATGWLYSNPIAIGTVDLTISKIAHTAFVRAGDPLTYTLTYGNNGSVAATGATISDIIPANTTYVPGSIFGAGANGSDPANLVWNLTIPANSGGHKAGFVVTVANTTPAGTAIDNTAAVANTYDSAASNQAQVTVAQDGVTISPNRSNNLLGQSQQVCYGHTVGNTGNLTNTMELAAFHNAWTSAAVTFYRDYDADGIYDTGLDTLLTDTNSNSTVDTGELAPGAQIKILACFTIPAVANDGDTDTLTVQAATAAGDTYTSQVTDITTVRIRNFLTITAPTTDLITNTASINYNGVTNPNATVVITNTTTGIVTTVTADGFGNFAATIPTTLGANTITASSTDLNNDVAGDTRTITRTPDPTDSTNDVTIIQPVAGTVTSATSVNVTGSTDPGSSITVTVGSAGPFTTTADDSGNFSLSVTLPEVGINTIEVTSTDPFGNVDTATRDITLTNDNSDAENTLTITSPSEGQVITTPTINTTGQTDPGSTITITISTGDVVTGTADLSDGSFDIGGLDLITGTNVITIVSIDPYGNTITETVTVILTNDTTPDDNFVTIVAPVDQYVTSAQLISVIGDTDPGSTITITTAAGAFTDTADNNGDFSTSVSLAYGWNTIVVTSTDLYGQVATETIQVRRSNDTTPGSNNVTIISPPVGYVTNTTTIPVTGTANADSVITATVGSAGPFTTTADSSGVYTLTVSLPNSGPNTIEVVATDIYGNQAAATREVTLTDDDTPDSTTVTITSPPAGYVTTATTTTVTGTGDPGATISIMVEGSGPFTTTVGTDGTFTVIVDLPTAGTNTLDVTATDPYGNVDTVNRDVLRQPFINFSGGSYSANEGGTATITVTLSAASNVTTTVAYATANGTAIAGSDYAGDSGVLTFSPGVTSQVITIPITGDGLDENNETFDITLSDPANGTFGTVDNATVTIIDGDDPPTVNFSASSAGAGEGSGTYTITVALDTASGLDVTIPFTVSGTATLGDDFTITGSPVTIPAGQTSVDIVVTLNDDNLNENDETIIVTMGTPDNGTTGTTGSFTLTIVDDDFTLTRYTDGEGSIGATPNQSTYTYGDVVTLTATAEPGWSFDTWSGDTAGSTNPVTVAMTGDKVVTATFTQDQYTLAINAEGQGWVISSPAKSTYTYGEVVTLTVFANFGWAFAGWGGDLSGFATTETITVTGDTAVSAIFTQDAYTLTLNQNGNGSVVSNPAQPAYNYGDTIILTATADPGWTFTGWSGDLTSSDNPDSFEIYQNTTVTATFTQDAYTLDLNSGENGSISVDPNNPTYAYGDVVTLTAEANPGWTFTGWSGDVSGSNSQQSVTITGTMTITANFSQDEYTLTVTPVGGGSVLSTPVQSTYHYGDVVTLTAAAETGWTFAGWSGNLSGSNSEETVTITGHTSVIATFTEEEDTSTTLDFSKTAMDINGEALQVGDTIRYTLQVINTGGYNTASNVVVTDTLPATVDPAGLTYSQGTSTDPRKIVWAVGDLAPGGTATMVITVTLNAASLNQSIVNIASAVADNTAGQVNDAVCPDGRDPLDGVCETKPQQPAGPTPSYGVFLPIIMR